ncbi:SDR family NAD(P)-dependent oxidoreductase [Prescottella agglutinans]|uniref:NAD(P)-dependent dehydrogenase (Short-subunit alcohol dehydrogenase family) n=1 Tax=Prescottella agglutinans TaxID=1644129 RepID=A0ABT6M7V3_9NOCA|nr:SDR family oxidoreductase [Prescottella agglutinans]MDH6279959.1 NAD(P)-dependent dehydrogenase (short-subunit alcohol dehydrogenase family) [Prescottella agglutinans]
MTLPLIGRSALVIGGAGGIGGAGARALLAAGASVTIMSRDETRISTFAAQLEQDAPEGATVDHIVGDSLVEADVVAAVERARHDRGLDICVSTVGRGSTIPLLLNNPDDFTAELRTNITSAFVAIKACVPAMAENGGGSMVFTSSVIAAQSFPYMSGYCAGKAGLEALVRTAADEFGHLGIRINCIRPGLVASPDNPKVAASFSGERAAAFLEQTPLHRLGVPDDIAGAIRYLAGPESSWVTGTAITVDGGAHMRRAPDIHQRLRDEHGDRVVDELLRGRIPTNAGVRG